MPHSYSDPFAALPGFAWCCWVCDAAEYSANGHIDVDTAAGKRASHYSAPRQTPVTRLSAGGQGGADNFAVFAAG